MLALTTFDWHGRRGQAAQLTLTHSFDTQQSYRQNNALALQVGGCVLGYNIQYNTIHALHFTLSFTISYQSIFKVINSNLIVYINNLNIVEIVRKCLGPK